MRGFAPRRGPETPLDELRRRAAAWGLVQTRVSSREGLVQKKSDMSAGTRYDVVGRKGDTKGFDGAPDRELVECRVGYRVSVAGRGSMACTGRRLNLGGTHETHLITDWGRGSRECFFVTQVHE